MNCPGCKQKLNLRFADSRVVGVSCPRCERDWDSERVSEIFNHCHEALIRQMQGIVTHMDFSTDCVEVRK